VSVKGLASVWGLALALEQELGKALGRRCNGKATPGSTTARGCNLNHTTSQGLWRKSNDKSVMHPQLERE